MQKVEKYSCLKNPNSHSKNSVIEIFSKNRFFKQPFLANKNTTSIDYQAVITMKNII